ncbi:MAG TPA: YceI family protein [Candidatus Krumholzibacteria bacterium]|nr:YceI family protein [Candidatus Krumholzibacteria bacterium]HPD70773.1 YceI family protein [Candidatus Krumholzibacteria bacterium]HRY39527.1 YceI family protein [Candidatus Krumholzibacteria bacterium]
MLMRKLIPLVAVLALALAAAASAATYTIDPVHSSVGFKVRHLMVSNVRGSFGDFAGSFVWEEGKPETWSVEATIQMTSIDTGNAKRDDHLRSSDFFDVATFPTMTFKSTQVTAKDDGTYSLVGDLTLRGVTKAVTLDLEFIGQVADPQGNVRVGFMATGAIDRQDFGVSYSTVMDNGGLAVGNEVQIELEIEAVLQK